MEIKRHGRYLEVDDRGYLIKGADVSRIPEDYLGAVEVIKRAYLERWGDGVHSLYLRGSVATGLALPHVSDIDSFAVLYSDRIDGAAFTSWAEKESAAIASRYPHVPYIELDWVPFETATDRTDPAAVILKLEAACIHGDDLARKIEGFKPGIEMALQMRYFHGFLATFKREYAHEGEEEKAATLAWIARRCVRLGMELVMEQEQRFTRDLYLCYESFATHHADRAEAMFHALELAVDPVVEPQAEALVRDLGAWLADRVSKYRAGSA